MERQPAGRGKCPAVIVLLSIFPSCAWPVKTTEDDYHRLSFAEEDLKKIHGILHVGLGRSDRRG